MKTFLFLSFSLLLAWNAESRLSANAQLHLENWLQKEELIAKSRLFEQISPLGSLPGTVIASPSKQNPNYYYHWVRDASLVMLVVEQLQDWNTIKQYAELSRKHQSYAQTGQAPAGLGEVKFLVDGYPFTGPWGRPQNDGPAIRALVFINWANHILNHESHNQEKMNYLREVLYHSQFGKSLIKNDLEYISHHWQDKDFDLWEEIQGHHFFTRIMQRKALKEGAKLARRLSDNGAADWYEQKVLLLEKALKEHLGSHFIRATVDQNGGFYKSGLDASVVIAYAYTFEHGDPFYEELEPAMMETALSLQQIFSEIYPINKQRNFLGVAIGRYPEDKYTGYNTNGEGNPWFLLTIGMAEFAYGLILHNQQEGKILFNEKNISFYRSLMKKSSYPKGRRLLASTSEFQQIQRELKQWGDAFLARVQYHTAGNGSMSEQINRYSGYMQGAHDLTWNYASFLSMIQKRKKS